MKNSKKKYLFVLALIAVLGLTACGNKNETQKEENNNAVITETPEDNTTLEGEQEATDEVTPEDTTTEDTTTEDTTTEDGATGTANINEEQQAVLNEIHTAVKDAYKDDYIPNAPFDETTLKEVYGLSSDMYDAVIAEGSMISVHVDTFIAVHPTEGNFDNVVKALTDYRETLLQDTMQYPVNLIKIQASKVETIGDYVFFIMLGYGDDTLEEAEAIASFEEKNDIAINAIKSVIGE